MASLPEEKVTVQLARLGGSKEPFEIDLYWTVTHLLTNVSTKFEIPTESLKLLCKGKMLNHKIADKTLKSLKIKTNDKIILMNKPQIKKPTSSNNKPTNNTNNNNHTNNKNEMNVDTVIERKKNISEIKAAAEKLAARDNDGYDWNANYYIELTNQYGDKISLPDNQRQALTVGLTLHEKGKTFIKRQQYKDAIYILELAFESLSVVQEEFLSAIDNYGLLALDIVWCYYLDQDEKNLSNAGKWLQIAEYGLSKSHGKNMERLKQIRSAQNMNAVTGDFIPELSLYVRLNILRALQSFYNGDLDGASNHLMKAEMDMRKLQVSDLDLVKLESMGFHHKESKRALRFCSGNIDSAINHIYNKRDEKEKKRKMEIKRAEERRLQRKYGATKNGKFVDLKLLDQLQGMGVEKEIAIEALRQTDNIGDETLNLCLDPQRKEVLAQSLFARFMNDKYWYKIEQIMDIMDNVNEARVRAALFLTFNDVEDAINMLSAPNAMNVVDLDRIEIRFIEYVEKRKQRILTQKLLEEKRRKEEEERNRKEIMEEEEDVMMDKEEIMMDKEQIMMNIDRNTDNQVNDDDDDDMKQMVIDDGINGDDGTVVDPIQIKAKAMPNPNLGDVNQVNDSDNKLVDSFGAIAHNVPNDDDIKIEQHILDDLDNDDESYLDIDLSTEQNALENLKVLLTSMQMNSGNAQNNQSFLSLFKK